MNIDFTKMQGIGNDFIVINCLENQFPEADLPKIAQVLNDRRFGIGGDGIVLVLPSSKHDMQMRMLNPDGSEAEMCGNGIRCFARYVRDNNLTDKSSLRVETLAGPIGIELVEIDGMTQVKVDMGKPRLNRADIPVSGTQTDTVIGESVTVLDRTFQFTAVSMGNPHIVIFEDSVKDFPLEKIGPALETNSLFPQRTNVHIVQIVSENEVIMRTWERGAGITLACGTGACATVVACILNNKTARIVKAHLPGGDLLIEWTASDHVMMTGPAETVFNGSIEV